MLSSDIYMAEIHVWDNQAMTLVDNNKPALASNPLQSHYSCTILSSQSITGGSTHVALLYRFSGISYRGPLTVLIYQIGDGQHALLYAIAEHAAKFKCSVSWEMLQKWPGNDLDYSWAAFQRPVLLIQHFEYKNEWTALLEKYGS